MSFKDPERQQFYDIVEEHYKSNFEKGVKKLSRYLGSRYAAEDILQTAYTNALSYWNTYDKTKPFDNWFRIVINNAIRAHFKVEIMHGMIDGDVFIQEETEERMLKPFFKNLELKPLLAYIEKQADNIKHILKLYLVEGYNSREIEKVVPESATNIRKIVQRFRDEVKLRYS